MKVKDIIELYEHKEYDKLPLVFNCNYRNWYLCYDKTGRFSFDTDGWETFTLVKDNKPDKLNDALNINYIDDRLKHLFYEFNEYYLEEDREEEISKIIF